MDKIAEKVLSSQSAIDSDLYVIFALFILALYIIYQGLKNILPILTTYSQKSKQVNASVDVSMISSELKTVKQQIDQLFEDHADLRKKFDESEREIVADINHLRDTIQDWRIELNNNINLTFERSERNLNKRIDDLQKMIETSFRALIDKK